jgi:MFS transporter, putative metabolite:H+ symporter
MSRPTEPSRRSLSPEHWVLLVVLGIGGFFEGYDSFIFTVALPQIRDTFGLSQATASLWLSILFIGSLPAVLLARYADVYGRKRLLLISIIGYSVFSGLTAVAPSMTFFVYSQFLARLFLNAEVAIAWTIVAEELPARSRGFGFGWLATMSAAGTVLSSLLYGVVFAPLGTSWRWLYVVALPPLAVVIAIWNKLPETTRFRKARGSGKMSESWNEILRPPHRHWFLLIGVTDMLFALAVIVDVFSVAFMQPDRGLSTTSSTLILMASAITAIPALLAAGVLSDRYGRKIVGCAFGVLSVMGTVSFFMLARSPVTLLLCLSVTLVGQFGAWPTLDAYCTELFPTRMRAFAGSAGALWRVPGEFCGLALGSALMAVLGGVGPTAALLACGPLAGLVIVWYTFPETKGLELEDLNDDAPFSQEEEAPILVGSGTYVFAHGLDQV